MNGKDLKLLLASVSVVFLLAEASAKPIASVEYFYAADGTLTGRAVNGKLQQYQYDKKGQLVAVVDALSRRMVEHYVYDPAGNILSKTVNEKTTTYIIVMAIWIKFLRFRKTVGRSPPSIIIWMAKSHPQCMETRARTFFGMDSL